MLDERTGPSRVYVDQEIRDQYLAMQARLPDAYSYTAAAGSITAGSATFTLPSTSSAEYGGDIRIQLVSDNSFLTYRTQDEIQGLRSRIGTAPAGRPTDFAPYEDSTQALICWVYPVASQTETYNLFRTLAAVDFSATDIAGTTLALSREAQEALIFKSAAAIGMAMDDATLATLKINPRVLPQWDKAGEVQIYIEGARRNTLEATGRIMRLVP
jgi:hypothetical protein